MSRIGVAQQAPSSQANPQYEMNCSDPANADREECANPSFTNRTQTGYPNQDQNTAVPQVPRSYSDSELLNRQPSAGAPPRRLPPEPLTELQKFVASSTGQVLPIFGQDLFRNVPSTFAPLDLAPVPSDYVIGPGDELRIRVWGQVSFEANVRVDRSGQVYLPRVGPVEVAGLPFSALQEHIRAAVGNQFRNFSLTVDIGQIRAIQVYVAGQARRPGVYTVSSLSSLLDALFASSGPSVQGSLRHVQLRRDGKLITDLDLYDLLTKGDKSGDVKLLSGDIVFIPPVGPEVALTGSVRKEGIYELRAGETLNDLVTHAGGVNALAAETRISIERIDSHREMRSTQVAFDSTGLGTLLAAGDLVHVYPIVPRYNQTVTLRGNLANPGQFAWHAGMRLSELIPNKEALLTRNYWWKRAQLGLPAPEFEPARDLSRMRQPSEPVTLPREGAPLSRQNQSPGDQSGTQQNASAADNADNLMETPDRTAPVDSAQPQNPLAPRAPAGSNVSLAAGQREEEETRQPKTEVRFLAPEIDWDYAAIERLDHDTLKTKVIAFDLGRLVLQHDSAQDLELQPGDVVTIFSEADIRLPIAQQSKLVKLEGEFVHAGSYTAEPGETLRDLVRRAGGFSPNAYLYGSEFTRESTRRIQQARIDEYARSLEMQTRRASLAVAAAALTNAQDIASSNAAQGSEQELIAQLHQIRATGRIVLEFTPDSGGANAVPNLELENGDTFVVPSHPANVNVVGAVYDQNSFLYNSSRHVGAYLQLAGGANRNADEKHEFVIRANGEVVSRDVVGTSPWRPGFYNLALSPGDTIVVPEKTFKPSAMRGVIEWTQVFSQLALGAASIAVIAK